MNIDGFQKKAEKQANLYCWNNDNRSLKYQIVISPEKTFYSKCLELCSNEFLKERLIQKQEKVEKLNGTVVFGKSLRDNFYIVISAKIFDWDDYTWRGTVLHEMTHACDIYEFGKSKKYHSMNEVISDHNYELLKLWSEFHARKVGFNHIWEYHYKNLSTAQQIEYSARNVENWKSVLSQNNTQYDLMQYLGRYAVNNDRFPDLFINPDKKESINVLFNFLQKHEDFSKIESCFNEFRDLLESC